MTSTTKQNSTNLDEISSKPSERERYVIEMVKDSDARISKAAGSTGTKVFISMLACAAVYIYLQSSIGIIIAIFLLLLVFFSISSVSLISKHKSLCVVCFTDKAYTPEELLKIMKRPELNKSEKNFLRTVAFEIRLQKSLETV